MKTRSVYNNTQAGGTLSELPINTGSGGVDTSGL